jgi:hypothetical protein
MMADQGIPVVPTDDDAWVTPGMLMHLSEMRGFTLPDPLPDVRGWKVALPDGRRVGTVEDLMVDTDALEIRYVEVKVDHDVLGADEDGWVLVPVGAARLDDEDAWVIVDRLPAGGVAGAPRQFAGHPVPTRDQERALRDYYGPHTTTADKGSGLFDQRRFWGRRGSAAAAPPIEAVVVEEVIADDIVTGPPKAGRRDEPRPRP